MVSLSTISKATVCRFSYINATTFYPLNYWVNLSGNVSDFHNSHVQLHSGKFPPCAYHTCQGNLDGKVESQADGVNAQFMAANQQTENNPLIK